MFAESVELRVTAAELVRQFGKWQQAAAARPVHVTHHGRDRFVLQSAASYAAMRAEARTTPGSHGDDALLDQMAEGYIAFDGNLRVIAINPAAAAYLRLPRAEAIGARLFEERQPLRRSLLFSHLVRALEAGAVTAFDAPSPTFEDRWLSVKTFPLGGGAACLLRDITDGVVERGEMAESAALRAALAAHDGIAEVRISARGTFVDGANPLAEMIGLSPETLNRARLIDVLPIARRRAASEALEAVLAGGPAVSIDTALLNNEGVELPARIALAPLRELAGPTGAIALVSRVG